MLGEVPMEGRRLTDRGFVFGMIVQHEQQHVETMLATHQLRGGAAVLDAPAAATVHGGPGGAAGRPCWCRPARSTWAPASSRGRWTTSGRRTGSTLPAFRIDTFPVSNEAYAAFVDAGGYDDPRWWTAAGWDHRQQAGLTAPAAWSRDGGRWWRRRFGRDEPVPPNEPVQHVTWYEADAYARWSGARLPTEAEWEKAARWDPATGRSRRYPWGDEEPTPQRANLGGAHLGPAERGAYPAGASPLGVHQLIGDVWEWCSSDFRGYPGFEPYPYREYSEVFFGDGYRMLRGGSWATDRGGLPGHVPQLGPAGPPADLHRLPLRPRRTARPMCRHLAYLGTPEGAARPRHRPAALAAAAVLGAAPAEPRPVNADGFGVGWYADGDPMPARYRRDSPMWTDRSFADLARVIRSGAVLAAVRSATPGMAQGEAAVAPFSSGRYLFSHNGAVTGWPASIAMLTTALNPVELMAMEAVSDSALLWLVVHQRLADGERMPEALGNTVRLAASTAGGRLNLLLTDGRTHRGHHLGRHAVLAGRRGRRRGRLGAVRRRARLGRRPGPLAARRHPGRGRHHPAPARRTPGGPVDPLTESLTLQSTCRRTSWPRRCART